MSVCSAFYFKCCIFVLGVGCGRWELESPKFPGKAGRGCISDCIALWQVPHAAHELALPHSGSMVMPHPASFAQQLMDPNISQQQIAQYHQQIAQFQPQAYHQQYHHGHLQEVPPLYFAQGIPPAQLQAYQVSL